MDIVDIIHIHIPITIHILIIIQTYILITILIIVYIHHVWKQLMVGWYVRIKKIIFGLI